MKYKSAEKQFKALMDLYSNSEKIKNFKDLSKII